MRLKTMAGLQCICIVGLIMLFLNPSLEKALADACTKCGCKLVLVMWSGGNDTITIGGMKQIQAYRWYDAELSTKGRAFNAIGIGTGCQNGLPTDNKPAVSYKRYYCEWKEVCDPGNNNAMLREVQATTSGSDSGKTDSANACKKGG